MELNSITFPGLPQPYKVTPASHLDDKNNPHGVTPEQIGAHPDSWIPTAAQVGAAPAGYGYGGVVPNLYVPEYQTEANINAALEAELKTLANQTAKQIQITYQDGTSMLGTLYRFDADHASFFGANYNGKIAHKYKSSGAWGAWREYTKEAFAPAGYGLGEIAKYPTDNDVHSIAKSGWYIIGQSTQNAFGTYGLIQANVYDDSNIVLFFYGNGGVTHARKIKRYGTWDEWEYINPKMELGVEYRTTERWNGKPVYTKLIDFGAMPNSTVKIVQHGITNIDYPLSASVTARSASWAFTIPSAYNVETDVLFSLKELLIKTTVARSDYHAYFTVKYTKL